MNWLRELEADRASLQLHVQPNARSTGFAGPHGDAMKLRLAAPAVDGKANAALIAFLAKFCEVPRSAVRLCAGATSRTKRVEISGLANHALMRLRDLR